MTWQQNLFSNLLVIFILLTLAIVMYCKLKDKTLLEFFKEIKEILDPIEDE